MLHIRGNTLGFAMFVAAAMVAGVGGFILKLADPIVMIAVGISLILMDFIIRLRSRSQSGWLIKKELGGYVYFVPVWGIGIIVIMINIISAMQAS